MSTGGSRFFASGDTSSEESEQSDVEQKVEAPTANRFAYESSEDEEEEKRVVRSQKDKRYEEMQNTIKVLKNQMKINDWHNISTTFDLLNKQLDKAKTVVQKEGVPKFYIKTILSLDNFIKESHANQEYKKKLNPTNARAFNTMKMKLKKNNARFTKEIEAYQKAPLEDSEEETADAKKESDDDSDEEESEEEAPKPTKKPAAKAPVKKKPAKKESSSEEEDSEEEESEEEESDEESEEEAPKKKKPVAKKKAASSDDESDADSEEKDEDSEEEWSQSESESDSDVDVEQSGGAMFTREFWMKKATDKEDKPKQRKPRAPRQAKAVKPTAEEEKEKKEEQEKRKHVEMTPEMLMKKLRELLAARGKRGTDKKALIEDLKFLASKAHSPVTTLKVLQTLASAHFEVTVTIDEHMPITLWKQCVDTVNEICTLVTDNYPSLRLSEDEEVKEALELEEKQAVISVGALSGVISGTTEKKEEGKASQPEEKEEVQYVLGQVYPHIQRLSVEYRKSLLNIDFHSPEYLARLKDEAVLIRLIERVSNYYSKIGKTGLQARCVLLRLEYEHYHYDARLDAQRTAVLQQQRETKEKEAAEKDEKAVESNKTEEVISPDQTVVRQLAAFLFKHGDAKQRTRAVLCEVYHLALHNYFAKARDLLFMSHVQDRIDEGNIRTRIMFNRAMAQLGMSAFRNGETRQALRCLTNLYQSGRIKELLAQGTSPARYHERDPEQEKLERRRQYPHHMHINLDMLEAVHLLSAMFAEVPNLAVHGDQDKRRVISKTFRRLFDYQQRQTFVGPPENTRDLVMAATKSMLTGDWQKTLSFLWRLRMWPLIRNTEYVKQLIERKVHEEALRAYLLSYASQYTSISLETLSSMFKLDSRVVYRIVSKMMVNEKLPGSWDQPSSCIIIEADEPNKLQKVALMYADKAALLVEANERLLDQGKGPYFKGDKKPWVDYGNRPAGGKSFRPQRY